MTVSAATATVTVSLLFASPFRAIDAGLRVDDTGSMDRHDFEAHGLRIGSGLDGIYVRALQVDERNASSLSTDIVWRPTPMLDDLYMRGKKARHRYPVGPGVFRVGAEGEVKPLPEGSVLVLAVEAALEPSRRGLLSYGELLVGGRAAARFRKGRWYYASDRSQRAETLILGPAELLGAPAIGELGPRGRHSALAG